MANRDRSRLSNALITYWLVKTGEDQSAFDERMALFRNNFIFSAMPRFCRYVCGQPERVAGGVHMQVYIELLKEMDFSRVVALFGDRTVHVEKVPLPGSPYSSPAAAARYCQKEDSRLQPDDPLYPALHPEFFLDFGSRKQPGKRTDIHELATGIVDKKHKSVHDMALAEPKHYLTLHGGMTKLWHHVHNPAQTTTKRHLEVFVYYGPTGSGKTHKALFDNPDHYKFSPTQNGWWNGYCGQPTVVIDEFRGQLTFAQLLTLLDEYPCQVQVKGDMVNFTPSKIIITSCHDHRHWYPSLEGSDKIDQLTRRITQEIYFPPRFDGPSDQAFHDQFNDPEYDAFIAGSPDLESPPEPPPVRRQNGAAAHIAGFQRADPVSVIPTPGSWHADAMFF